MKGGKIVTPRTSFVATQSQCAAAGQRSRAPTLLAAAVVLGALLVIVIAARMSGHIFAFPANVADAPHEDLIVFYSLREFLLTHELAQAYDPEIYCSFLKAGAYQLPFLNPPYAAFIMAPLGMASYGGAKSILFALSIAATIGVVRLCRFKSIAIYIAAVFSPALFNALYITQLGPLLAFATLFALMNGKSRPLLAALAITLVAIKPQYGLMIPVFLAAAGAWRTILYTVVLLSLAVFAAVMAFGADAFVAFFSLGAYLPTGPGGPPQVASATIGQLFAKIGAPGEIGIAAQMAAIGAAAIVTWIAVKTLPFQRAAGLAMIMSLVAAPSAWSYDWNFVLAAILMLGAGQRWPLWLQAIAALAWIAPLASFLSLSAILPNITLVLLAGALSWRELGAPIASAPAARTGVGAGA